MPLKRAEDREWLVTAGVQPLSACIRGSSHVAILLSPLVNRCAAPSPVYLQQRRVTVIKLGAVQAFASSGSVRARRHEIDCKDARSRAGRQAAWHAPQGSGWERL